MDKFRSKPFYFTLTGEYALFTDPMSKGGGEKFTYSVPTWQALVGITECIYFKPTFRWYIDEVKILNTIKTETKGVRTWVDKKNSTAQDLSNYTYLKDVRYAVKVYFEWNMNYPDLEKDRNEVKHQEIMLRSLKKGGRRDIFLGTRECVGFVEKLTKDEYDNIEICETLKDSILNLGIMFHSFTYPNQAEKDIDYNSLTSNFSSIVVENGVIRFCRPEECEISRNLGSFTSKYFDSNNVKSVEEEWGEY